MAISAADWAAIGAELASQARQFFRLTAERWAALPPVAREGYVQRFRLAHLYWIEDEHGNKLKFKPTPIQWAFFNRLWWRSVVLKARQVRISTAAALLTLDRVLFSTNHTAGIVDKTDEDAKRKLARIKFAYDHLDDRADPRFAPLGAALKQAFPIRFSNAHEFHLHNESKIWASTSMRGGTVNTLWITELGVIAVEFPEKAKEIKKGALNAIHSGALAIIEATFEGGRVGVFYDLIRLAQQSPADPRLRQPIHWDFRFFGWADEPTYAVELPSPELPTPKQAEYFAKLEKTLGRKLTAAQKNWYIIKAREQGPEMTTEFPGTAEEALQAIPEGAIYGDQMLILRATGRICPLVCDFTAPLFTSWDLGDSDATGVWLLQIVGPDIHALDFHCANGATAAQHADQMKAWETKYRRTIATHYLPHDGKQRKAGTSWEIELRKAGLEHIRTVDRIGDIWIGIGQTRALLPRFRFNSETCEKEFVMGDETKWPSGIAALEAYRKKAVAASGNITWEPIHDECESGASSLRTFCEAHARGLLVGPTRQEQDGRRVNHALPQAKMGLSRPGFQSTKPRAIMR